MFGGTPGRRRVRRFRAGLRRPSVATPALVGRALVLDFILIGLATFASTFWPAESGSRHTIALRCLGLAAVVIGPAFFRLRRLSSWLLNSITTSGTLTITAGIYLTGGGTSAAVASSFYLVVVVHVFYAYPRIVAWLHVGFVGVMCTLVLHNNRAVGVSELIVLLGVAAATGVLVSWLVRAADLAEIDYLTGLTNRRGFETAADELFRQHTGTHELVLVMIDLDDFRSVNERLGHAGGDDLLLALARQWQHVLPSDALLARHGGDEFALILVGSPAARVDELVHQMRSGIDTTFSAGIAWRSPGEQLSALLARADAAVYEAKRNGRACTVTAAEQQSETGEYLLSALAAEQFALYYQPIIDLQSGVVTKAEALIRWLHPERGLIPPDEFISRAEQSGAILQLGDWIVRTACQDSAAWAPNADGDPIVVSINVSGLELQDPSYTDRVLRHLNQAGLTPGRLVIELVETDYNTSSPSVTANLDRLAAVGVGLAMDDFGTGHSSLSRLQHTDVNILKIDRSFINAISFPDQPMPLITAILAMASALALDVVAEGVETPEQAEWLRAHGCRHAQGYLYGRPQPHAPQAARELAVQAEPAH